MLFDFTDEELALLIRGLGWADSEGAFDDEIGPFRRIRDRLVSAKTQGFSDEDLQRRADAEYDDYCHDVDLST